MRITATLRLFRLALAAWLLTSGAWSRTQAADSVDSLRVFLAGELDRQGKLGDALPLYAARAEQTRTQADRLRYASALLRSGRTEQATEILDALAREGSGAADGSGARAGSAALVASAAMLAGFPALAVRYARAAYAASPSDSGAALLLFRALAAAGNLNEARAAIRSAGEPAGGWDDAERFEIARFEIAAGDRASALRRLAVAPAQAEVVGLMFRDSVRSNLLLLDRDWPAASRTLGDCKRMTPRGLGGRRVARQWRNVQRELYSVELRHALSLWREGKHTEAVDEAREAAASDEEYVHSAALLLLASGSVAQGRRDEATSTFERLAGHDRRFSRPLAQLGAALGTDADPGPALAPLRATLGGEDHSLDFATELVVETLAEAPRLAHARPIH
ncbi:MAG TPA: hypothetical protein VEI94_12430 [Candidatus Bathyarchaeia archaeon]|nr:hypothetical protein [Candidatus Bathyarchaeia archaeon]